MSQEKVAKYKEQKAHRKEIIRKEKRARIIRTSMVVVICAVALGWIGYSGVDKYIDSIPREMAEVDYTAVTEYMNGLNAE